MGIGGGGGGVRARARRVGSVDGRRRHAEHTKTRKVPTGGGEAAPAAAPASASTRNTGTNGGALGALAAAALSPDVTDDAATRALVVLCSLDRLPAGDWPGALRRLTRRGGDQNPALVDACVALAVAHPGPAVGGGLLESLLGSDEEGSNPFAHTEEKGAFDEFGVREVAFDGDGGRTRRLASPPPPRVLAALGECVAALPRAAAAAALRRCVAAVAVVVEASAREHAPRSRTEGAAGTESIVPRWMTTIRRIRRRLTRLGRRGRVSRRRLRAFPAGLGPRTTSSPRASRCAPRSGDRVGPSWTWRWTR